MKTYPNHTKTNRQLRTKMALDKLKDALKGEFVKRVKAGEKADEVLAALNRKWCNACDTAKAHPATKEVFALEIDQLLETTMAVARRMRLQRIVGRIMVGGLMFVLAVAASVVTYGVIQHFKFFN